VAQRILAVTDKSIAWLADASHRDEAVEILVKNAHSTREDAQASYDFLRHIEYFEPDSKISRAKLENVMVADKSVGNLSQAFSIDRLAMPGITTLVD
jgi:ABC-type nitrate/sulfonate/bicarbonate transport system substrate-binding protein